MNKTIGMIIGFVLVFVISGIAMIAIIPENDEVMTPESITAKVQEVQQTKKLSTGILINTVEDKDGTYYIYQKELCQNYTEKVFVPKVTTTTTDTKVTTTKVGQVTTTINFDDELP